MVISGHVIEHTKNPYIYLKEHLRVLEPGGLLFIEFPNRYYHLELHTGLFSFEWLPKTFRNNIYKNLAYKWNRYHDVLTTLHPISKRLIDRYCKQTNYPYELLDVNKPLPGFVRILILKKSSL